MTDCFRSEAIGTTTTAASSTRLATSAGPNESASSFRSRSERLARSFPARISLSAPLRMEINPSTCGPLSSPSAPSSISSMTVRIALAGSSTSSEALAMKPVRTRLTSVSRWTSARCASSARRRLRYVTIATEAPPRSARRNPALPA